MGASLPLQSEDKSVLYAVASTLVNCTNSYDHEEPDPQMLELAKYAKQHVPEQHPKVSSAWLRPELTPGSSMRGWAKPGSRVGMGCPRGLQRGDGGRAVTLPL